MIHKKRIKIQFTNGLRFEDGIKNILSCVSHDYDFIDSQEPEFIVFGPYGNHIPKKGRYTRIGYFCENMKPDMSLCEWAFGIPYNEEVKHPKYMRISWHGFDPNCLIKKDTRADCILSQKTKFCNFVYSNKVPFRESFFKRLSQYKRVDAPGQSMNNMPSIDVSMSNTSRWDRKRSFLADYKFTIAFENYSYPGYNTEKLLDPMTVNSLPIYLGNPHIHKHFNPNSFINAHEYANFSFVADFLQSTCYPTFKDQNPSTYTTLPRKIGRKVKSTGRTLGMQINYRSLDNLIDKIVEIDQDDDLYIKYCAEPWFNNNVLPSNNTLIERWKQIFG